MDLAIILQFGGLGLRTLDSVLRCIFPIASISSWLSLTLKIPSTLPFTFNWNNPFFADPMRLTNSDPATIATTDLLIRSLLLRPDQPAVIMLGHFSPQLQNEHGFAGPDVWHSAVAHFYDVPHLR